LTNKNGYSLPSLLALISALTARCRQDSRQDADVTLLAKEKTEMKKFIINISFLILSLVVCGGAGFGQTSEISYQGRLAESGNPVTGTRFFRFTLFDENGVAIPGAVSEQTLQVSNGIFSATLNFGAPVFVSGANRSLQIEVKINAGDAYTLLNPRQPVLSAPYSIRSLLADDANRLGGTLANQFVLTNDSRLFDARTPTAGSGNYIQNSGAQQTAGFNISGNGFIGGNLGIGTTSPLAKLTVQTPTGFYGFLHSNGAGTSFGSFLGSAIDVPLGGWFGTQTNHPLYFFTNSSLPRMTVTETGFVGIGTTAPLSKLEVINDSSAIRGIGSGGGIGVFGKGFTGIWGESLRIANSNAIYGDNDGSNTVGHAGVFNGRVAVIGTLTKSGGSFKIDHPLDPANKYLYHSFVESPDMMNIYNGNVTTDAQGKAIVTMPEYFAALNRDFRYQLTVIGQFAQAIVAEEIKNNSFVIRTDKPHVKVSWQVTGIRQDAYANENRIPVEENKPAAERGFYLYPKGFNQPAEKSVVKLRERK
jgi:hypothetical protein